MFTPINDLVSRSGRATTSPPSDVRAWRTLLAPSATHIGQWKPTGAWIMQSGQIDRPHRVQRM
jgi:hypothetical protein